MPSAGADRNSQVPAGVSDMLEKSGAVNRLRRVADRAVVVQRRFNEAVPRGASTHACAIASLMVVENAGSSMS
jgi:predicted NAD/FAD-binding protein